MSEKKCQPVPTVNMFCEGEAPKILSRCPEVDFSDIVAARVQLFRKVGLITCKAALQTSYQEHSWNGQRPPTNHLKCHTLAVATLVAPRISWTCLDVLTWLLPVIDAPTSDFGAVCQKFH